MTDIQVNNRHSDIRTDRVIEDFRSISTYNNYKKKQASYLPEEVHLRQQRGVAVTNMKMLRKDSGLGGDLAGSAATSAVLCHLLCPGSRVPRCRGGGAKKTGVTRKRRGAGVVGGARVTGSAQWNPRRFSV